MSRKKIETSALDEGESYHAQAYREFQFKSGWAVGKSGEILIKVGCRGCGAEAHNVDDLNKIRCAASDAVQGALAAKGTRGFVPWLKENSATLGIFMSIEVPSQFTALPCGCSRNSQDQKTWIIQREIGRKTAVHTECGKVVGEIEGDTWRVDF